MKPFRPILASVLFASMLTTLVAAEEGWTRFRGPDGQGLSETSFPASWTRDDYLWRIELAGEGSACPVIDGDRIFITSGDADGNRFVQCLRTTDGGQVWRCKYNAPANYIKSSNNYAAPTPTIDADRVYTTWGTAEGYEVVALAREDGQEVWRRNLGPFVAIHGFGASPILFEGKLIVPNEQEGESCVVALDAKTGETVWKTDRATTEASYSTPMVVRLDGDDAQLIFTSWVHGLYALDPIDGRVLWETPTIENRVCASPVRCDDIFFLSGGKGGVGREMHAFRLIDGRAKLAYDIDGRMPYVPTAVAKDGLVYLWCDKGDIRCLKAATGEEVGASRVSDKFYGSPILAGDRLYCISRGGVTYVLTASPELKTLAEIDLEEDSDATPAIADGVMYLRTKTHLMALGAE